MPQRIPATEWGQTLSMGTSSSALQAHGKKYGPRKEVVRVSHHGASLCTPSVPANTAVGSRSLQHTPSPASTNVCAAA